MVYTLFISSCLQISTLKVAQYPTLVVRSIKNIVIVCNYDKHDENLIIYICAKFDKFMYETILIVCQLTMN